MTRPYTNGAVCLHAHFYQPPREDPATGQVPVEASASPHHDWNHRITAECYEPCAGARILDDAGDVARTVNLYEKMSFNVGPTLGSWLDRHAPTVTDAMRRGDVAACTRLDGHGGAIAQPYVHAIVPLCSVRDQVTLVRWGLAEFRWRFGRDAEGMWLPETAIDTATLEVLAAHGIAFTIAAPHQVTTSHDVPPGRRGPLKVELPSGRAIAVFAYDGALAHGIAFGELLRSGDRLAESMLAALDGNDGLVNVATDGETFGHHHMFGEMAVAWALQRLEAAGVEATSYGAHLAEHPPIERATLVDNTSWSCTHGVERWRSDCGCRTGSDRGLGQQWRAPLRVALDWLIGQSAALTDDRGSTALRDPWRARDDFVKVVLDARAAGAFLSRHLAPGADATRALTWMGAHHHLLLAQSSCGWFFDDPDGLETAIVLRQAAAAVHRLRLITGVDLEIGLLERLEPIEMEAGDGRTLWAAVTGGP